MDLKAIWTMTGLGGGSHICRHMCPFCPQLSAHRGSYSLYRCPDCLRVDPLKEFPCCHTEFVIGAVHELALPLQEARDAAVQAGTALILLAEAEALAKANSTLALKAQTAAARPGASAAVRLQSVFASQAKVDSDASLAAATQVHTGHAAHAQALTVLAPTW
jgi:hypothetical protein